MKATYKRNNLLAVREAPSKEAKILDTMTPGESAEVDYTAMKAAELREIAEERGIKVPARASKPELIALLNG